MDKVNLYDMLESCCQRVAEKYGKPDRASWTNSDYIRLAHILFKKTSIHISPNTLKRTFGKIRTESGYYPQKATRDALASYAGFNDWDHFLANQNEIIQKEIPAFEIQNETAADTTYSQNEIPKRPKLRSRMLYFGLTVLMFSVLYWGWTEYVKAQYRSADLKLICQNPVGKTPHTAVFQVKGMETLPDDGGRYLMNYGDGKTMPINRHSNLYSHYYESPGRYYAGIALNGSLLSKVPVFLPTDGWDATGNMLHDTTRVYPVKVTDLFSKNRKGITASEAATAGIDTSRTFFIEFTNTQKTKLSGDNFEINTRITSSADRTGVRCAQVGLTIFGESGFHKVDLLKPGCTYWSHIRFSEVFKDGTHDDLVPLGADFQKGGDLKLRVENQMVILSVNGTDVFRTSYQVAIGKIYGVQIKFAGIGAVHSLNLRDLRTGEAFSGNF